MRGQRPAPEAHRADLNLGAGAMCARCGNLARGRGEVGSSVYCHPSCGCHPSCYMRALTRDWLEKHVPPAGVML